MQSKTGPPLRLSGGQGSLPPLRDVNDPSCEDGQGCLTRRDERSSGGHSQEEGEGDGDDGELHLEWCMVGRGGWESACRPVVVSGSLIYPR
jgi:hypothetical protein